MMFGCNCAVAVGSEKVEGRRLGCIVSRFPLSLLSVGTGPGPTKLQQVVEVGGGASEGASSRGGRFVSDAAQGR